MSTQNQPENQKNHDESGSTVQIIPKQNNTQTTYDNVSRETQATERKEKTINDDKQNMTNTRLEAEQIPGKGWRIIVCAGSRKKGTFRAATLTEPIYTLAQAQTFINNTKRNDYTHLLDDER